MFYIYAMCTTIAILKETFFKFLNMQECFCTVFLKVTQVVENIKIS